MHRYLAAFMLAFVLVFGLFDAAHASTEDSSSGETFSWSTVASKALLGTLIVAPAVVYFSLNKKGK